MVHSAEILDLDVAVPVHNEQVTLERSVRTLHPYRSAELDVPWRITIANNASLMTPH